PDGRGQPPALGPQAPRSEGRAMSAHVATPRLRRAPLAGMALFIASESIFFLSIVAAFIALRGSGLATAKTELDVGRTFVFSLFLFASSATMTIADRRRSRDGRLWLVVTAVLGAVFLAGQGLEYLRLLATGVTLLAVGLITSVVVAVAGASLAAASLVGWVRILVREESER